MLKENRETLSNNNVVSVATGLFIGSTLGAVTMLLLAPQSGKRTRTQIQQKGIELRDQAAEKVKDTVALVQMESKKLSRSGRQKAKEFVHQSRELAAEQLEHVSEAVTAGKKAILGS